MILTSSCPLRISLVGGSTDHPTFLDTYGSGSVISFPSNLRTYVTSHGDLGGFKTHTSKYILNHTYREEVNSIDEIENELIRNCFEEMRVEEMSLTMNSDVFSTGSGLSTSSSYLMSLIKNICGLRCAGISDFAICELALKIERKFNPLVGEQDFYGGGIGGFKRINFSKGNPPTIKYLPRNILEEFDMFLIFTGISRQSKNILSTIDHSKSLTLLDDVNDMEESILSNDRDKFISVFNRSWENKKLTSSSICSDGNLGDLDRKIESDSRIYGHKLCGAGAGGYFLVLGSKSERESILKDYSPITQVWVSGEGIKSNTI
jgi:D-glycero-alpha-D-manno-heptose-7-phosphate kinase